MNLSSNIIRFFTPRKGMYYVISPYITSQKLGKNILLSECESVSLDKLRIESKQLYNIAIILHETQQCSITDILYYGIMNTNYFLIIGPIPQKNMDDIHKFYFENESKLWQQDWLHITICY